MSLKPAEILRIEGHQVNLTRPEKVLFPEDGITKGDLIRYYERIAPRMLPYLEGRPLTMERFPDGIGGFRFFQKAAAAYYPSWIKKTKVRKVGGTVTHVICENAATLVYLANQASITLHAWLSRIDKTQFPDQMIFDLDPSTESVAPIIDAAHTLKNILDELELESFVKATGSRGLHITVPLDRSENHEKVRAFARSIARLVVARDPDRFTMEQYKAKRRGRVFIDTNRNAYAQTAVAVYSVRARRGAPVAVPLDWAELRRKNFSPGAVTIRSVFERLEGIEDPWRHFWRRPQSLEQARERLERMRAA